MPAPQIYQFEAENGLTTRPCFVAVQECDVAPRLRSACPGGMFRHWTSATGMGGSDKMKPAAGRFYAL